MIITVDTTVPLSNLDRGVLIELLGMVHPQAAEHFVDSPAPVEEPAKPKAKSKAKPAEAAPAETPAPAETEQPAEPMGEELLKVAVETATALLSNGKADVVRAALSAVGAKRVSEVADTDVAAFLSALSAA